MMDMESILSWEINSTCESECSGMVVHTSRQNYAQDTLMEIEDGNYINMVILWKRINFW